MLLAAYHVLTEVGPWNLVGRVEHAQLEAAQEGLAQVHVKVGLADEALVEGVAEGDECHAALQVRSREDGVN